MAEGVSCADSNVDPMCAASDHASNENSRLRLGVGIGIGIGLGLGLGRRSSVSWRPLEGWWVASKGLGPLPSRKASALGRGCDMGGRVALRLARAAAVSTR